MEVKTEHDVLTMNHQKGSLYNHSCNQSRSAQLWSRAAITSDENVLLADGGANPEGSLASGSSAIEYQKKYELGSECSCRCSGVTIWTILTVSSFCI